MHVSMPAREEANCNSVPCPDRSILHLLGMQPGNSQSELTTCWYDHARVRTCRMLLLNTCCNHRDCRLGTCSLLNMHTAGCFMLGCVMQPAKTGRPYLGRCTLDNRCDACLVGALATLLLHLEAEVGVLGRSQACMMDLCCQHHTICCWAAFRGCLSEAGTA